MATTPKGYPYPIAGAANDVPAHFLALATKIDERPGVEALTTVQRNALAGPNLWDGRIIANTTVDRLERYDSTLAEWLPLSEAGDLLPMLRLLARTEYNPATYTSLSTTSTTLVDVDAANLSVTATPTKSYVFVHLDSSFDSQVDNTRWGLRSPATGYVPNTMRRLTGLGGRGAVLIYVGGLVPGVAQTWRFAHAQNGAGITALTVGGTDSATYNSSTRGGPATMDVFG